MTDALTARERLVWECVATHLIQKGYAPTLREICQVTGIPSISLVSNYLNGLHDRGLIRRDACVSRGIVLLVHPVECDDGRNG